jgi:hypothetical protein
MHKPLVRAALVASTLAAVLLPAGVAAAASVSIDDATGDTYAAKYDESTDTTDYEPAGSQVNVDLDEVVVRHTARKVIATATYVDLKRTDNRFMYLLRLRTNEGLKRDVTVETLMSSWKGSVMFGKPNGDEVKCTGIDHAIDYVANTVTVSVPRRCLSNPRYVQAFTAGAGFSDAGDQYFDHGHMADMHERIVWSDKIRTS